MNDVKKNFHLLQSYFLSSFLDIPFQQYGTVALM